MSTAICLGTGTAATRTASCIRATARASFADKNAQRIFTASCDAKRIVAVNYVQVSTDTNAGEGSEQHAEHYANFSKVSKSRSP